MFCPHCGNEVTRPGLFCGNCGNRLAPSSPVHGFADANPVHHVTATASTAQGIVALSGRAASTAITAKVISGAVFAAVIAAGIFLYNMYFVTHPHDVVEKFVRAFNEKDLNTTVTCLDPKYEKMYNAASNIIGAFFKVSLKDIADLFPALYSFAQADSPDQVEDFQINNLKILSEEIDGDNAKVYVNLDFVSGNSTTEFGKSLFVLKKFNEGWRIVDIEDVGKS